MSQVSQPHQTQAEPSVDTGGTAETAGVTIAAAEIATSPEPNLALEVALSTGDDESKGEKNAVTKNKRPADAEKPSLTKKNAPKQAATGSNGNVAEPAKKADKEKKLPLKKPKVIRDSFTIPETDYELFAILKRRALDAGLDVKKSELLRAGLAVLAKHDDDAFMKAVQSVDRIKTGRPKK